MRFEDEIRYPAGATEVAHVLADPGFLAARCEATGAVRHEVDVDGDPAGAFTVTTLRVMPTDQVPDFVRSFVGATLDVTQTDRWQAPAADGSREGTIDVQIAGAPVALRGRLHLHDTAEGSVQELRGDLKASVPLLGGKVEKAAEPAVRAAVRQERTVAATWLAR